VDQVGNIDFKNKRQDRRLSTMIRNRSKGYSNKDSPICIENQDLLNCLVENPFNILGPEEKEQYDFVHNLPPFLASHNQFLGIGFSLKDAFLNHKSSCSDHQHIEEEGCPGKCLDCWF
jgi:hypothetical protein